MTVVMFKNDTATIKRIDDYSMDEQDIKVNFI